jgi:predicted nucleotidyltransferase
VISAELVSQLAKDLAHHPIALAVLFGSHATGQARRGSDLDLGILPLRPDGCIDDLALASSLSEVVGAEVDLVRLDQDHPLLGYQVASYGQCIYEARAGIFAEYRARAMSTWIDFEETVAVHRQHRLKRLAERQ